MTRRRGLGAGLGGLIAPEASNESSGLREIPVAAILPNPHQPRGRFADDALEELTMSIREHGVLQPLVVTELPSGDYQLIAGERRWRAARRADLATVPVVVKEATPQQQLELALIENIQRADLDALEEARAYRALADEFNLTHEQIAQRVGKSRPLITQMLGLLKLPLAVQELVSQGELSMGHVRPLSALKTEQEQREAARMIVERGMNARQAEALVGGWRAERADATRSIKEERSSPEDDAVVENMQRALGVRVQLRRSGTGGRLVLFWDDEEMLDALYQRLLAS
jgi:ParB family transcriptional regulator, chromosome partitioning protein